MSAETLNYGDQYEVTAERVRALQGILGTLSWVAADITHTDPEKIERDYMFHFLRDEVIRLGEDLDRLHDAHAKECRPTEPQEADAS